MIAQPLRLLLVEDDDSDAQLLHRHLQHGGLSFVIERVETATDLSAALQRCHWDLVISDYHLPGMTALTALALVRRSRDDLPFIVISGQIGEERAVELMRAGAQDFVVKGEMARLVPAIERELAEAVRHQEQARLDASVKAQESRLQMVLSAIADGVWEWNPQTGASKVSPEWKRMLGYVDDELHALNLADWRANAHPNDRSLLAQNQFAHHSGQSALYRSEHRLPCKDGGWKWVLDRGVVIERDEQGRAVREVGTMTDISAAKQHEAALRESHLVLQKLSRQVPGMLYQLQLDADGRMHFPFVSAGIFALFELHPQDVVNNAQPIFARIHPEDYSHVSASVQRSARDISPWADEMRVILPNKGERWVRGESQPELLPDGSVLWNGYIHDVTEQMNAEKRLRMLQACIEQVNDSIIVTEAEPRFFPGPRIVYANTTFEKMTGYSCTEVIGQTPRILQGPGTDFSTLREITEALEKWQPVRVEILNYRKSGEAFWSELDIAPVADAKGHFTHWISVQRDITERKQAEDARECLFREVQIRNSELDHFNQSVAHDLRNPIITIRGMADLAEIAVGSGDNRRVLECLARISRSTDQADTLIRSLMELAKLGKRALRLSKLPALATVQAHVCDQEVLINAAHARVEIEICPNLELDADAALLRVILQNLLTNALRHRDPSRLPCITIRARATQTPSGVEICLDDNGQGIEPEAHGRVFRLFERLSDRTEGTGIGLALVDRAVRMHDGYARLERSELGVGSSFSIWLPKRL